jgi:hypothetical protein
MSVKKLFDYSHNPYNCLIGWVLPSGEGGVGGGLNYEFYDFFNLGEKIRLV